MVSNIPVAPLASTGKTIPHVGFGTAAFPFHSTEQSLGEAITEALRLGLIKSRDELFINSKFWFKNAHGDLAVPALQTTLKNLGLEYLDLYLIHYPLSLRQGSESTGLSFKKEEMMKMDFESVWGAMEECQKIGLTKSIGVSNFSCKKLEDLLATAKIPPVVNQMDLNPVWQQKKLRKFCEEKGIHITAYSPLGAKGTLWGTDRVMDCQGLQEIASAKGKTLAQGVNLVHVKICLQWVYEQRTGQSPQSSAEFAASEGGPYKSIEDFWDGEI
ncbi:hypothetical protein Pint_22043 [Pistacia integerrima]|uniref:Uncharacterized protein n=1 Tax=Pistacia integerrima TaxID=434235 RepID=A0ACC0YJH4_9ROSI|nr:hypothetical protein Pint_22043 [Pistacia integerrima]